MQKKIVVITTLFIILGIVLGVVLIREKDRLSSWQEKSDAEIIEQGGLVYMENCATCHGKHAKSELCFLTLDDKEEQIACMGRPLNNFRFLCGEPSQRLQDIGWEGSKYEYIRSITTVGNMSEGMPAFGKAFRYDAETALSEDQIENVTAYLLNFDPHICTQPATPVQEYSVKIVSELPAGDRENGQGLYELVYGCAACHGDLETEGSNAVGSWGGIFKDLDNRIEGYTAADYVYESILSPSAHISPDCPIGLCAGPPSAMPDNYGQRISNAEMADIMAYLGIDTQVSNQIEIELPK